MNLIKLIFAMYSLSLTGCSIVGIFIGNSLDINSYNNESTQMIEIDSGQTVKVITNDDKLVKGKFICFSKIPFEEYEKLYNTHKELLNNEIILPELGEELLSQQLLMCSLNSIYQNQRNEEIERLLIENRKFYGFDSNNILFSNSNYDNSVFIPASYFYENQFYQSKRTYKFEKIIQLLAKRKLPTVSQLRINVDDKEMVLNLEHIKEITKSEFPIGALLGFAAGITIDYLTVIALILLMPY
jgi:hypothetical protein